MNPPITISLPKIYHFPTCRRFLELIFLVNKKINDNLIVTVHIIFKHGFFNYIYIVEILSTLNNDNNNNERCPMLHYSYLINNNKNEDTHDGSQKTNRSKEEDYARGRPPRRVPAARKRAADEGARLTVPNKSE